MKYSKNFERDYNFYLKNIDNFTFYGNGFPKFQAIFNENGLTAKDCFHKIESTGKNHPCKESELLNKLLACKASINFHIKLWSEGLADGTLTEQELINDNPELSLFYEWVNKELTNCISMKVHYNFPDWVVDAIKKQAEKKRQILNDLKKPLYLYE